MRDIRNGWLEAEPGRARKWRLNPRAPPRPRPPHPQMGGSRKARNSAVAPIFRQKAEKAQAPSLEHSPSDSDSEMSSQAASDRAEAPLTRRDMKGFLADIRKSVAEELDKKLGPIMEGMADLSARTQATETKMAEAMETVQAHGGELQALREQLRSLEESNEDLNNRSRRNNIR
ncbi:Hypothetical predicted protein, partial [Pelobates cultripes]